MLSNLRRKKIVDRLDENGSVRVKELSRILNVTEATIRQDLEKLEKKGVLQKVHGGAVLNRPKIDLLAFDRRLSENSDKKNRLGKLAADFVKDNDVIFIDCGTTLYSMHNYLKNKKNLIVISNSLPIIFQLSNHPGIKTVVVGGEVDTDRKAIYGPIAEKNVEEYHASKAFIGSDGVTLKHGLSSDEIKESVITTKMAENSDEVFLVVTSEKIEREAFIKVAPLGIVDHIITNSDVPQQIQDKYRGKADLITDQ